MLTANILQRVLKIEFEGSHGTAFTYDIGGHHYLVTAAHVVGQSFDGQKSIKVFHDGSWSMTKVSVAYIGATSQNDVCFLSPTERLSPPLPIEYDTEGIILGQDVFWCGFPRDISQEYLRAAQSNINNGFPIPFVRKGVLSNFISTKSKEMDRLLVDGHNVGGFSGSPLVWRPHGAPIETLSIAGVVSGHLSLKNDVMFNGKPVDGLYCRENSGTLIANTLEKGINYLKANRA